MYHTHHFAHRETLERARAWLTRLGFSPDQIEVHTEGAPRICLRADLAERAKAQLLFHAIESADPDGWPGLWELANRRPAPLAPQAEAAPAPIKRSATAIGWHPPDSGAWFDPEFRSLCEAMSH